MFGNLKGARNLKLALDFTGGRLIACSQQPDALAAGKFADAVAHLGRGLVGERDRKNLRRMHTFMDEVRDPVGEHPRLARTGAGHHEQRPLIVNHGIKLIRVQSLNER